ncbi:cytochrome c oxidase accessory protein CcoG [Ahniella affigens]|uniref:Cytochrome c oxidase accessory protein CcoG n=2 Tax=Ahniella affigens TaxID=2021234 RepID=A0A2P1PYU2_9GAMM|nr:cytochrome c oxidase accessory protein CcoG [Ahniella affigens]
MYVSERKIYPRDVDGTFQRLRRWAVFVLLGLYYGVAWFNWDGRQAVLWDLPARKFYVFGLSFWPQDFIFLALLLIIAGLSLFFFTALAGRLWCGYACPQTVWTETFLWIEHWLEGDRPQRMKLDAGPWNANKIKRKGGKHLLWIVFALWTGFTFVGYFTPIRELAGRFWPFEWSSWETFWVLFYSFATWGNAGFMREQVCKYMCPYARFQSAMFDRDTLIIAYDEKRGEDRGARKRGTDYKAKGLGDCIDCTICVQVCPTGIDIRDGLQYECIACGSCIDACDEVMDRMGYPRGLVRYTTQHQLEDKQTHVFRWRIVVYAILLLAITVGLGLSIAWRKPVIMDVIRDRNALYRETYEHQIQNGYMLRIINKTESAQRFELELVGPPSLTFARHPGVIELPPEEVRTVGVMLSAPASDVKGKVDIEFVLKSEGSDFSLTESSRFFAPE